MDLLQSPKEAETCLSAAKEVSFEGASFLQIDKLEGDHEDCYLEDTLRELNFNIQESSK
jgi:hypothetical protein